MGSQFIDDAAGRLARDDYNELPAQEAQSLLSIIADMTGDPM